MVYRHHVNSKHFSQYILSILVIADHHSHQTIQTLHTLTHKHTNKLFRQTKYNTLFHLVPLNPVVSLVPFVLLVPPNPVSLVPLNPVVSLVPLFFLFLLIL